MTPVTFDQLWESLLPIGREESTGGYRRFAWTEAGLACRAWFTDEARRRSMAVETDRNGNLWAWWDRRDRRPDTPGEPPDDRADAVVTGSHLDSVPDGGAYDGPLGIVSAFAAVDLLRERAVVPRRPLAVVAFSDEEGARFGIACVGSRLLTGALDPIRARALTDPDGIALAKAMRSAGADPDRIGRDDEALRRIGCLVELHIEQGRALTDTPAPVAVANAIWPHGRWRFDFTGAADHAGTTRLEDRRDPMLTFANTVLAVRKKARLAGARATVGRVRVQPNGTNAIPSAVQAWLDARAADEPTLDALVRDIATAATERGGRDGVEVRSTEESRTPAVEFDAALRERIRAVLGGVPQLPTAAGHDAGILAAVVPTAMLFVRNPTGVSHSPAEHAERADCRAGVSALAAVLEDLLSR